MGCTSAKQVSAVPNDEEGRGKAYSNGDLFTDEYKMKGVEEVKYMRGEDDRVNARNQENLQGSILISSGQRKVTPRASVFHAVFQAEKLVLAHVQKPTGPLHQRATRDGEELDAAQDQTAQRGAWAQRQQDEHTYVRESAGVLQNAG